jgi:hypothetical protein
MSDLHYVRVKEEAAFGRRRLGAVILTVGKWLLIFDVILLSFVYVGLRGGSQFWMWWVIIEAVLGLVLIGVGSYIRNHFPPPPPYGVQGPR